LGADPDEADHPDSSDSDTTDEEDVDSPLAAVAEVGDTDFELRRRREQKYEVGEFVTAVYEGQWLLAQVDIKQDEAGDTHVNLSYMQRVGDNQFKWPKHHDLLLTLKEDILTRCSMPVMVGSSIRANYVGLSAKEAHEADTALATMVYLQSFLFQNFLLPLWVPYFPIFFPYLIVRAVLTGINYMYGTVLYSTVLYGTVLYGTVLYGTSQNTVMPTQNDPTLP
jgi:hypothetical protein